MGAGGTMAGIKPFAIVLVIAGAVALAFGGFSYTRETHVARIGSLELSAKDRESVNVPAWAGLGMILIGGVLLAAGGRRQ
jgi:hypothetical protein